MASGLFRPVPAKPPVRLGNLQSLPPAGPQDSFSVVAGVGQPSGPERTSVVPGVYWRRLPGSASENLIAVHVHVTDAKQFLATSFLRKTRIGGNGSPSFRAGIRTLRMLRWSAAAARMIDAPCATNSLRRALSSSVQGLLAKPTIPLSYFGGLSPPAVQLVLADCNGSLTSVFWTCSHFGHSKVRSSKPLGLGSMRASIMRPWHFAQRGCSIGMSDGSGRL